MFRAAIQTTSIRQQSRKVGEQMEEKKKAPLEREWTQKEIAEALKEVMTDPIELKNFIVNVLGREWEERSVNE